MTDLEKTRELLKMLGIIDYEEIQYQDGKFVSEIRMGNDSGKLTFNGYCWLDINFNEDGSIKEIDVWGD